MKWPITVLVAAAMTMAGIAFAAGGDSNSLKLCAEKNGGALSLAAKGKCGEGERKLTVSKRGPAGPQGAAGPTGPQGAAGNDGTTASIQPEAVHLVGAFREDCAINPGFFCKDRTERHWDNAGGAFAPVGYFKDAAGFVHLKGTAQISGNSSGTGDGSPNGIFYLPTTYRPTDGTRQFVINTCQASPSTATVTIASSGLVDTNVESAGGDVCAPLDGILFRP